MRNMILSLSILTFIILPTHINADNNTIDFTIRYGQGGFQDSRSPEGKLGGGQLALDVKHKDYPIVINISTEFYTNRPVFEAYNTYEITDLNTINILYISQFFNLKNTDYFFGGGIGQIEVPADINNLSKHHKTTAYNMEVGINWKYFKYVGFYGVAKYLNANKTVDDNKVIDFSENIILLGITFNFSAF